MLSLFALLILFIGASTAQWNVTTFKIDLTASAKRMQSLVASYRLPIHAVYPGLDFGYGTDLNWFRARQETWARNFTWEKTQAHMNRCAAYYSDRLFVLTLCLVSRIIK